MSVLHVLIMYAKPLYRQGLGTTSSVHAAYICHGVCTRDAIMSTAHNCPLGSGHMGIWVGQGMVEVWRQQCGSALQQFHSPLPPGTVEVHCGVLPIAPQALWQCITTVPLPTAVLQCIAAVPLPPAPRQCGVAL